MENLKLVSPWVNYYREIVALFGDDPDIEIDFDEDNYTINMFVNGVEKTEAISELLPEEKVFGNITLRIHVFPSDKEDTKIDLFRKAFEGNPAFSYAVSVSGVSSNDYNFVVFKNTVVQYYNDDLSDVNGNRSTLYQEIAKDIFEDHFGVYFCTDTKKNLGKLDK